MTEGHRKELGAERPSKACQLRKGPVVLLESEEGTENADTRGAVRAEGMGSGAGLRRRPKA